MADFVNGIPLLADKHPGFAICKTFLFPLPENHFALLLITGMLQQHSHQSSSRVGASKDPSGFLPLGLCLHVNF